MLFATPRQPMNKMPFPVVSQTVDLMWHPLVACDISVTHRSFVPVRRSVDVSRTDPKANCDTREEVHPAFNPPRLAKFDMFNAPRPARPYGSGSANLNGLGGSFVDENPLASSVYDDGLDPWSAAPSPSPPPAPAAHNPNGQSLFKAVICTSISLRGRIRWL